MTKDEADHLAEGDRVKSRQIRGTVVGNTANCVSIQWDGRDTPEIFTTDDMRNVRKRRRKSDGGVEIADERAIWSPALYDLGLGPSGSHRHHIPRGGPRLRCTPLRG